MRLVANIRRLQFIGKQHLLNIPANLARESGWRKGDYLEIVPQEAGVMLMRKVADTEADRDKVMLAALEQEAAMLYIMINSGSAAMNPGEFSGRLAQLSHVQAKIRKLRLKIGAQAPQKVSPVQTA